MSGGEEQAQDGLVRAGCVGVLAYIAITLLTIVLVLLKLLSTIDWSWSAVFLPFIIMFSLLILFLMVGILKVYLPRKLSAVLRRFW